MFNRDIVRSGAVVIHPAIGDLSDCTYIDITVYLIEQLFFANCYSTPVPYPPSAYIYLPLRKSSISLLTHSRAVARKK